jgi:hypothetical protein
MKTLKMVMIATILLFVPAYAFSADLGYMRISLIEGDVQIKTPDAGEWGLASINGPLAEGDQVWTPQGSRAELQLNNGTYIRLDQDSALQILSMDKDSSQFYLSQGHAYIYYNAPMGSVIQIDTPDASARAFNRAIFSIDISDRYTDAAVYKGYIKTENNTGSTRINAGQMLSLGQNTNGEVAPLGPADEWEDWNNARNYKLVARRDGGSRYLPAELRAYSADLDDNGRWVSVPEYGNVWTPTVVTGAGWSPYKTGRWIWRGGDYVWVASESWGWAPYHYGRWAFVARFGWCWVPPISGDVYWSPGYVGWVRTPDYVAWVPLAPGERYYGRGNYGRNSVNITKVNVTQINVTTVYKNVNINNGVTVVNRHTFNTGSPTIVNVNRNIIQQKIFVKNNISVGAPEIKPARGSFFVSARPIPSAKLPPQPLRNVRVGELKQSRPFVREPDKSVLNHGAKPRTLQVTTVDKPRTPGRDRHEQRTIQPAAKGGPVVPGTPGSRVEKPQTHPPDRNKGGASLGPAVTGAKPQFQPRDNGQIGVQSAPAPRRERPQTQAPDRGKSGAPAGPAVTGAKPQFQPRDNRQIRVQSTPAPRSERPQVQAPDRGKSGAPAGPAVTGAKPQFQPRDNRQIGVQSAPAPRSERPQVQTLEKGKSGAPAGPAVTGEKPQFQPRDNRQIGVQSTPVQRSERPQVQAPDRGKSGAPAGPSVTGAKPQFQPRENRQIGVQSAPVPRGEKPQVQTPEKGKSEAPVGPAAKGGKKEVKPVLKGEPGAKDVPDAKGEKKAVEPVEGEMPKKGQ